MGETEAYFIPPQNGKSPQKLGTFGNGEWVFRPDLTKPATLDDFYRHENITTTANGLAAKEKSKPAFAILRVNAANIVTSAKGQFEFAAGAGLGKCSIAVSTNHGHSWQTIRESGKAGREEIALPGVKGAHQYLVKVELHGSSALKAVELRTITQLDIG